VIVAGGVEFKKARFEGEDAPNVVYGDSREIKRQAGPGEPVVMIGGANSAGQAAIDVASSGRPVSLLIRSNIRKGMSDYLIRQIESDPKITVLEGVEVETSEQAEGRVRSVTLKDGRRLPSEAIGVFIGSGPKTDWTGLATDEKGRLLVGGEGGAPLETSMSGVYAAGDIRSGAVARVVMASADGAHAIALASARVAGG
jgi:thioredoxin reductase (NADPH)